MDFRQRFVVDSDSYSPLVSIGVASYNYSMYVLETLNSILHQTYNNIELFVVDDFSTDNSVQIIEQWIAENNLSVTFIKHLSNKGRTYSCNEIISQAKGKYIVIFSSDDVMYLDKIKQQVESLENADEDVVISYSNADLINEDGLNKGEFYSFYKIENRINGNALIPYLEEKFSIPAPTVMFRKSVFFKVGLYDERLYAEDFGMWMKILPFYKIKYCEYTTIQYRIKENTPINDQLKIIENETYHRDRTYIYTDLIKVMRDLQIPVLLQQKIRNKINFHVKQLAFNKSKFTKSVIIWLLKNGYYKLPYKSIFLFLIK